ncbi:KH domain-containing protein, partial [Rhizobium leguminosarum]|uniref:KH domain-containing protein n=1 Tax=Rhizobium leguminosarum TaxID=384 RepID=UPI003F9A32F7
VMSELKQAGISKVVIERPHKKCRFTIHSARPGLIIGRKGADIDKLRKKLSEMTNSETHLQVFVQQLAVLGIVRKPAAITGTVDAEAE